MKIGRIKVLDLQHLEKLTSMELREVIGGYGGDGGCFYDCMSWLSKEVCGTEVNPDYFRNDYADGKGNSNDNWGGLTDRGERWQAKWDGPKIYKSTGELNTDPLQYMSNYFDIEGSEWASESSARDFWKEPSSSETKVMGAFEIDASVAHAVILTGYDEGKYSYYDPSTGCSGNFEASKFIGAVQVKGCK